MSKSEMIEAASKAKCNLRPDVMERITQAYIACALWSSTDDNGEPLDRRYGSERLTKSARRAMRADVWDFVAAHKETLEASGLSDEQIGHDFWLTRNGHGTGFWDRGHGRIGEALTKAAKAHGVQDLYANRGWIYAT